MAERKRESIQLETSGKLINVSKNMAGSLLRVFSFVCWIWCISFHNGEHKIENSDEAKEELSRQEDKHIKTRQLKSLSIPKIASTHVDDLSMYNHRFKRTVNLDRFSKQVGHNSQENKFQTEPQQETTRNYNFAESDSSSRMSRVDQNASEPLLQRNYYGQNLLSVGTTVADQLGDRIPLYIGGLFELTKSPFLKDGFAAQTAAELARKHVNERNIIPGYSIHILYNDTQCDPGVGADAFYDLVYRKPQIVMLLGGACSEVTETLAEIAPFWNLILVSYGALSPTLSDREKYPTFYRLAATDTSHNPARKLFIQRFGWTRVAVINQGEKRHTLPINDMLDVFGQANISLTATMTFRADGADIPQKMKEMQESGARILLGSFHQSAARQVFCEAYKLSLYGARYVWILPSMPRATWWESNNDTDCTHAQLLQAVDGYFAVTGLHSIIGSTRAELGLNQSEFDHEYHQTGRSMTDNPFASLTYDSIWTVAFTLRKIVLQSKESSNLRKFSYHDNTKEEFADILGSLSFQGMSGPVSFDGADRRGLTAIAQHQGTSLKRVALYYPEADYLDFRCDGCRPVQWRDNRVPVDGVTILVQKDSVTHVVFIAVCCVSSLGILLALVFLCFNLYHRRTRYIKLSSPKLNNVAVLGCIMIYVAVIVLGFDDSIISSSVLSFAVLCNTRAFLFAAGFSLAFGAMFAKTYRVHQIFRKANQGLIKSKLLQDKQLLLLIGALLVLDSLNLLLWILIDPMQRQEYNLTMVPSYSDPDIVYIPVLARCRSDHQDKFLGAYYAFKGLLLLFGVYMAWETRHVKIPVLNDSQYIGMSVYNVVLTSVIVVAVSSLLPTQPTLSYAVVSVLVILSTTGMLCLLFLPKVYAILRHNGDPVITSSGLTVAANTRRFATDEKKEGIYRAQVQNRVYKRQIVELDQEIQRLERSLEQRILEHPDARRMSDEVMMGRPEGMTSKGVRPGGSTSADDPGCSSEPPGAQSRESSRKMLEKKDEGFQTLSYKGRPARLPSYPYLSIQTEGEPIPSTSSAYVPPYRDHYRSAKYRKQTLSEHLIHKETEDAARQPEQEVNPAVTEKLARTKASKFATAERESPTPGTSSSDQSKNTGKLQGKSDPLKAAKMAVLKKELKRIHEELVSLGEIHVEINEV